MGSTNTEEESWAQLDFFRGTNRLQRASLSRRQIMQNFGMCISSHLVGGSLPKRGTAAEQLMASNYPG
jgi:hypothetical protein